MSSLIQLARYLLAQNANLPDADWTAQGFGFLRLRISDNVRLHVWDSRLRVPGVSDIHDHAQWALRSTILSGELVNVRYDLEMNDGGGFMMGEIVCGIGGGMQRQSPVRVDLIPRDPEIYRAGASYSQEPQEIHRSLPADGTVTLIEQTRRDTDTARVFWPLGTEWGDAIPRIAKSSEVREVCAHALARMA